MQDNCIVAEKGTMKISADKKFLEFVLQNGFRYQERGNSGDSTSEFIKLGFKEYKKLFDVSSLKMNKTSDTTFRNDSKMLSIRQLTVSIDSLKKISDSFNKRLVKEVNYQFQYPVKKDSIWKKNPVRAKKVKNINEIIPDTLAATVLIMLLILPTILKILTSLPDLMQKIKNLKHGLMKLNGIENSPFPWHA